MWNIVVNIFNIVQFLLLFPAALVAGKIWFYFYDGGENK